CASVPCTTLFRSKRIKLITGKSLNELVRFVRLRRAATLLITSDSRVNEAASITGFNDLKYFRKQFQQQYGMNPSEFQKKYRGALQDKQYVLNENLCRSVWTDYPPNRMKIPPFSFLFILHF